MKYRIKYIDSDKNKIVDYFDFDDEESIKQFIKKNDYSLVSIQKIENAKNLRQREKNIKIKDISLLLTQMNILLKSGIDIKSVVNILSSQEKNPEIKNLLKNIELNLESGMSLSESFDKTNAFSDLTVNVIDAGEKSSNLSEAFDLLSIHYEKERKLKSKIRNSLYYPIILLIVTIIVVNLILIFVVPNFMDLYESFGGKLPMLTQVMLNISFFLSKNIFFIIIGILIVIFFLKMLFRNYDVKYKFSKFIFKIPVWGKLTINFEIQRFSRIFAMLINSGMEIIEAIGISGNSIGNLYLRTEVLNSRNNIMKGASLYQSFSKIEYLPNMFLNLINVGEISSSLKNSMNISAKYYENLSENENKKFTALFEPLIIIFVSIIVGFIVIAIALPTVNVINLV